MSDSKVVVTIVGAAAATCSLICHGVQYTALSESRKDGRAKNEKIVVLEQELAGCQLAGVEQAKEFKKQLAKLQGDNVGKDNALAVCNVELTGKAVEVGQLNARNHYLENVVSSKDEESIVDKAEIAGLKQKLAASELQVECKDALIVGQDEEIGVLKLEVASKDELIVGQDQKIVGLQLENVSLSEKCELATAKSAQMEQTLRSQDKALAENAEEIAALKRESASNAEKLEVATAKVQQMELLAKFKEEENAVNRQEFAECKLKLGEMTDEFNETSEELLHLQQVMEKNFAGMPEKLAVCEHKLAFCEAELDSKIDELEATREKVRRLKITIVGMKDSHLKEKNDLYRAFDEIQAQAPKRSHSHSPRRTTRSTSVKEHHQDACAAVVVNIEEIETHVVASP